MDEFRSIGELFRPLTDGAPEALELLDDAAALPSRSGLDLIVTQDALVEGVHFLADDPPDLVARKLLRVNLSDLAAKGAEPYGYFLSAAWPKAWDAAQRGTFAAGLRQDQTLFGVTLFGGDTVSTPGPLTLSVTMMGWVTAGGMVKRSGAGAGEVVLVSGAIGDSWLGLAAARGELAGVNAGAKAYLANRYRLPEPRLALREMLRAHATAAADVSDGLLADTGHVGNASGLGVEINLDLLPLSDAALAWVAAQPDRAFALARLATGGDDYEIVCTVKPQDVAAAVARAAKSGVALTPIGLMTTSNDVRARSKGREVPVSVLGWTHP